MPGVAVSAKETRADLIVVGAGPAGASAALAAHRAGLAVVLIDEAGRPGGQVWRAPASGLAIPDALRTQDDRDGAALRAEVAASGLTFVGDARVWSVTGRFRVDAATEAGTQAYVAPRLVAATGAHERVVPFPGWTLPGVIGLAAATILLKSEAMLPGRRTVVAGCGPLLAAVAAKIVAAGGTVAALVDLAGPADWMAVAPRLARRPRLLRQGLGWMLRIGLARVPVHFRHAVVAAEGAEAVEQVVIAPVDAAGAPVAGPRHRIAADALAVGHGLVAGAEIPRLLRAALRFDALAGGWIPVLDAAGRTSIDGLYAAGDGAGIAGAAAALLSGRLAGLAAAHDAGALAEPAFAGARDRIAAERDAVEAFAGAVRHLMRPRRGLVDGIAPETVVCRCEDVTRAEIDAAVAAGAREVNQLKHFTRCGMGPCQGRFCGDTAAELVARHVGSRAAAGVWTGRPPLRPVPLDTLLGDFDYADIPVPKPAPL